MSRPNQEPSQKEKILAEIKERFKRYVLTEGANPNAVPLRGVCIEPYFQIRDGGPMPWLTIDPQDDTRERGTVDDDQIDNSFDIDFFLDDKFTGMEAAVLDALSWMAWIEKILTNTDGEPSGHYLGSLVNALEPVSCSTGLDHARTLYSARSTWRIRYTNIMGDGGQLPTDHEQNSQP
jgi:hypothetical protein